jgi:hypothetical protein
MNYEQEIEKEIQNEFPCVFVQDATNEIVALVMKYREEAKREEHKRCVDLLDHNHENCSSVLLCIGYQNAQSDLINNPPTP